MHVVKVGLGYGFTKRMTVQGKVLFPGAVSTGFERQLQGKQSHTELVRRL